jgi:hypothetical protein
MQIEWEDRLLCLHDAAQWLLCPRWLLLVRYRKWEIPRRGVLRFRLADLNNYMTSNLIEGAYYPERPKRGM